MASTLEASLFDAEDLAFSIEIIDHEDAWDDTSTLASFRTTSTDSDDTNDSAGSDKTATGDPNPGPARMITPPPLPERLPAVCPIPSQAGPELIFPRAPAFEPEPEKHDPVAADLALAETIRNHFLAREDLRQKDLPDLPHSPGSKHSLSTEKLKAQVELARAGSGKITTQQMLFRAAANLEIGNVMSYLEKGIAPHISFRDSHLIPDQSVPGWFPWNKWGGPLKTDRSQSKAEMMRLLVAEGMGVDYAGLNGITPLCAAVEAGRVDIIEWLLNHGADVNVSGTVGRRCGNGYILYYITALDYAVARGEHECVDVLLQAPNVNARRPFFVTHNVALDVQKDGAINVNDRRVISGVTALHLADPATAQKLIDARAYMTKRDNRGRSPFHWACEAGSVERAKFFLDRGFPVDERDGEGATGLAIICAAHERGVARPGVPDVVRLLLKRGANSELQFPQRLSIRTRFWMMEDWRGVYEGIFEEAGLLRKCLEEELERMKTWSTAS